jgi:predicted nucleic-acid-binding Zn-ribbon protein
MRIQQALDELKKRGVESDYCPRCNTSDWNVDILEIPANSAMSRPGIPMFAPIVANQQATGVIPLLGIVCKNCGYAIFHNLNVLGV